MLGNLSLDKRLSRLICSFLSFVINLLIIVKCAPSSAFISCALMGHTSALYSIIVRISALYKAANDKNEHIKRDSLLSKLKLPSIADYMTHKRLSWIGHALRRSDKDRSRRAVIAALENKKAKWAQLVVKDCAKVKVNYDRLPKLVLDKNKFREHFSRLPTYSGQAGTHRPPASKKHEQMRTKLSQTTRSASRRSNLVEMG